MAKTAARSSNRKARSYDSPLRRQQAEATRAAICASAAELFERDGYAVTTINAIADRAGVSSESVYSVFGTKRQLLRAVFEAATAGDEYEPEVLDGAWVEELRAEQDTRCRLSIMRGRTQGVLDRSAALHEMVHVAARTDPELKSLEDELDQQRRADVEGLVAMLDEVGALRMSAEDAADVMWAVAVSDLYLRLRRGCSWPAEKADDLMEDLIARMLLP